MAGPKRRDRSACNCIEHPVRSSWRHRNAVSLCAPVGPRCSLVAPAPALTGAVLIPRRPQSARHRPRWPWGNEGGIGGGTWYRERSGRCPAHLLARSWKIELTKSREKEWSRSSLRSCPCFCGSKPKPLLWIVFQKRTSGHESLMTEIGIRRSSLRPEAPETTLATSARRSP
jgi:hypothetical protein